MWGRRAQLKYERENAGSLAGCFGRRKLSPGLARALKLCEDSGPLWPSVRWAFGVCASNRVMAYPYNMAAKKTGIRSTIKNFVSALRRK